MIKLKQILKEAPKSSELYKQGRTKEIDKAKFLEIYNSKCIKLNESSDLIYRYIYGFEDDYGFVNPIGENKRVSAYDANNYYTLLLDNLPSWKNYPKRSESLICTSDVTNAMGRDFSGHGGVYIIIPFKNSNIAITSNYDIWLSFPELKDELKMSDIATLNHVINELFDVYNISQKHTYESFIELESYIKKDPKRIYSNLKSYFLERFNISQIIKQVKHVGIIKFFDDLLNPEYNGMKLITATDDMSLPRKREIWTDGQSLVVRQGNLHILGLEEH